MPSAWALLITAWHFTNTAIHPLYPPPPSPQNEVHHVFRVNDNEIMNDNEITLFRHIFIMYKIYFTSAYVLITLVIKTYMCPGDLISAKLCRYHKATKIISKYVLQ